MWELHQDSSAMIQELKPKLPQLLDQWSHEFRTKETSTSLIFMSKKNHLQLTLIELCLPEFIKLYASNIQLSHRHTFNE